MNLRKQNGLTLIGFGVVLTLVVFFAYTGMRVIPIYLEYNALLNALKTVQSDPGSADMEAWRIRRTIIDNLWVSYASNNIKNENIHITRANGVKIRVVYEVRKPWIANLDLLAHFDKSVTLSR